jgi:hypothetical protein
MHLSKEKIFLEPIDKYFEDESKFNDSLKIDKIDFDEKDLDFQKLDEELCQSLNLLDENEYSTEVESEECLSSLKPVAAKRKKLLLKDILNINKENIIRAKMNTINKYISLAQNNGLISNLQNNNFLNYSYK